MESTYRRRHHTALRVAFLGSEDYSRDLSLDAALVDLSEDPHLALIEAGVPKDGEAETFLQRARERGIAALVLDDGRRDPMPPCAALAATVVTLTEERRTAYEAAGVKAHVVAPWVQAGIFHPMRRQEPKKAPAATTAMFANVGAQWLKGCGIKVAKVDLDASPDMLRAFPIVVVGAFSTDPWNRILALRAAACGSCVIHAGILSDRDPLRSVVVEAASACDLAALLEDLAVNRFHWARNALKGRRHVLEHFVLPARLTEMAALVGVDTQWEAYPLATVFVPTRRPALLESCIAQYRKQTWPNKELILVINSREIDRKTVEQLTAEHEDVRIVCVSQERNVGTLMNVAIDLARGSQCIKMDDDDWYGEHYVSDMMLNLRAVDADVYGKPPGFIYFSGSGEVYQRRELSSQMLVPCVERFAANEVRISGATLSGRTEALRTIRFSTRNRGAVDTAFHEATRGRDLIIAILDGFGTVVYRSADPAEHTWRVEDESLKRRCTFVGSGEKVIHDLLE